MENCNERKTCNKFKETHGECNHSHNYRKSTTRRGFFLVITKLKTIETFVWIYSQVELCSYIYRWNKKLFKILYCSSWFIKWSMGVSQKVRKVMVVGLTYWLSYRGRSVNVNRHKMGIGLIILEVKLQSFAWIAFSLHHPLVF